MGREKKIGSKLEKPPRLSEQVAAHLLSKIKEGVFRPGERLPSEAVLAEQFGVSRTVIREALARLKYDGLLDSRQGIGATVVQNSRKCAFRLDDVNQASRSDIRYLFELRAILEGNAAFLAAERRTRDQLQRLHQCVQEMAAAVRDGRSGTHPDVGFHSVIAEASSNPYLSELMQFLNDKLVEQIRTARDSSSQYPDLPLLVQQEHETIYEAIAAGDPVEARRAMLAHIQNARDRLGVERDHEDG